MQLSLSVSRGDKPLKYRRYTFGCWATRIIVSLIAVLTIAPPFEQAAAEQVLNRSTGREPRSLDPHLVFGSAGSEIAHDMFEGLLVYSPEGLTAPGSAKSFDVSDDGLVYTFILRDDLRWSDGRPLTAGDFVYSLRRLVDPGSASPLAGNAYPIKNARAVNRGSLPPGDLGVAALDNTTLEIELEAVTPYFAKLLVSSAFMPIPEHVVTAFGDAWTEADHIVTNGAYTLLQWSPREFIRLQRNGNYYGAGAVEIDRINYIPVEDESLGLKQYRGEEIDILRNFPVGQLEWLKQNFQEHLVIQPSLQLALIFINFEKPPYDNPLVREALSISIDRQILVERLLGDGSLQARNLVTPVLTGYGPNEPGYASSSMDLRRSRAAALLAQAGYENDSPLKIILKFANFERFRRIAVAIQGFWRGVGIDIELDAVGPQVATQDMFAGNFGLLLINHVPGHDDPMGALEILQPESRRNYSRYKSSAFGEAVEASMAIADASARYAQLRTAEASAMSDIPVMPLYFRSQRWLVNPRVEGWGDNLRGLNYSRNLSIAD